MTVSIIDLGRVGDETKGVPDLRCPALEPTPKTQRRLVYNDLSF
jgi:hypothetical protein